MSQEKVIKNPLRTNDVEYRPYIPQYKQLNIEPEDYFNKKIESSGSSIKNNKNEAAAAEEDLLYDYVPQNYIDNNEYVSDEVAIMMGHDVNKFKNKINDKKDVEQNKENKFILIVKDIPVFSSNSEEEIKHNVELLLLGEHNKFLNEKISLQEIFLYKKINISYGVFFKE